MANGMSSLMVGATGLKSAQGALNTTAHNLANINTEGYTRQQISFTDTQYMSMNTLGTPVSSTVGMGVNIHEVRRLRNEFIDKAYRTENGRYGYYNSQYKAVEEIEDLFGEMQGVTYQESMKGLYDSINELSKEPASTVKRSSLMQNASAFLTRSDAVYEGLTDYQQTLNEDVLNTINSINDLCNTIYDLNKQISKIEAAGQEKANDLRDQRDEALDELSEYVKISYYDNENGETMVQVEGVPMVTSVSVLEMSYRTSASNNLYIPTFPGFQRDVYTDEALYSAQASDQGSLKGLLLARGCVTVDYTDIPVKPTEPTTTRVYKPDATDTAKYPNGETDQAYIDDLKAYNDSEWSTYDRDYAVYEQKQAYYNKYIEPSAILCAIAGLDKLVNGITTNLNSVLCPTVSLTTDQAIVVDGKEYIPDSYEYLLDSDNGKNDVLYDAKGRAWTGVDYDGKKYYTSTGDLYTHELSVEASDSSRWTTGGTAAKPTYSCTSTASVLYDEYGNQVYYTTANSDGTYTYTLDSKEDLYEYNKVTPTSYNYSYLDMDTTDYGNDDARSVGEGIFSRYDSEDYVSMDGKTDANGTVLKDSEGRAILLHNNSNTNGLRSDFTLGNIIMDEESSQNVAKLPFTTFEYKEDMSRGQALLDMWNADFATLDPESYAIGSFEDYYNNFTSDFATLGNVLYNFVDQQQVMVDSYDDQRQQTTGVSSDDELQKMIKYQQAYNAASRYINVISEMLEHIVTSLGNA